MRTKMAAGVGIAVIGLTVFAAEQQGPSHDPKVIRLKSNGQTVAELRIFGNSPSTVRADGEYSVRTDKTRTAIGGTNSVMIKIGGVGQYPITVTAQEAEVVSGAQ